MVDHGSRASIEVMEELRCLKVKLCGAEGVEQRTQGMS